MISLKGFYKFLSFLIYIKYSQTFNQTPSKIKMFILKFIDYSLLKGAQEQR